MLYSKNNRKNIFKRLKERKCEPRILYSAKTIFRDEVKNK